MPMRSRMSNRCWMPLMLQLAKADRAAAIARSVAAASAELNSPTTSSVFAGLMSRIVSGPSTHSPPIRLPCTPVFGGTSIVILPARLMRCRLPSKPRAARLRMRARTPKVHGGALSLVVTRLIRAPNSGAAMLTTSSSLWGEAQTFRAPVLHRGKQGPREQHQAVRILVRAVDRLRRQVEDVAADRPHAADILQHEAVGALDTQRHLAAAHVVDPEAVVEQPDERPERARCVVVLRLAEQQRAAPLEVAQVDVVAERGAHHPPIGRDHQHHFRLGIVPVRSGCRPISAPVPTADSGCALVKTSASGPMPTSRYCDHIPRAISASFSRCASSEPGRMSLSAAPTSAVIVCAPTGRRSPRRGSVPR